MDPKQLVEELKGTIEGDDAARKSYLMQQAAAELERVREALLSIHAYAAPFRDDSYGALDRIAVLAQHALYPQSK